MTKLNDKAKEALKGTTVTNVADEEIKLSDGTTIFLSDDEIEDINEEYSEDEEQEEKEKE
jgi:hypothetical protein